MEQTVNNAQVTSQDVNDFLSSQSVNQAPMSDSEFQAKLNEFMTQRGKEVTHSIYDVANTCDSVETYDYQPISDLDLPHLNNTKKALAIDLANKIRQAEISIEQRNAQQIVVSKDEIDCLSEMRKEYKALVGQNFISSIKTAKFGDVQKVFKNTVEGIKKGVVIVADTGVAITDTAEEISCDLIDGVSKLAIDTINFGGTIAKGGVGLTASALRSVFNMVSELASK